MAPGANTYMGVASSTIFSPEKDENFVETMPAGTPFFCQRRWSKM
jgi:hypothetical protein